MQTEIVYSLWRDYLVPQGVEAPCVEIIRGKLTVEQIEELLHEMLGTKCRVEVVC